MENYFLRCKKLNTRPRFSRSSQNTDAYSQEKLFNSANCQLLLSCPVFGSYYPCTNFHLQPTSLPHPYCKSYLILEKQKFVYFIFVNTETVARNSLTILCIVLGHCTVEAVCFLTKFSVTLFFHDTYYKKVLKISTLCATDYIPHTH